MENQILTSIQIDHKIQRIAYQIYETFVDDSEIILAGISGNGYVFAQKIAQQLHLISPLQVTLCEVFINKSNCQSPITTSIPENYYAHKAVVLVDDVLHSGTTLIYGVKHFLNVPLTKLKTAVLVDRNHKKYPIKADFKGISLSTSLQNNVEVVFSDNQSVAFLK